MDEPKSLDSLFKEKILRIPDYQRGYAWQKEQLKDFWEDLINLSDRRNHYTGVLTLKQVDPKDIKKDSNEFWLIDDHSYKSYYIVDGQQRLTTFVIFIQSVIEFCFQLPANIGLPADKIYISDSLNLNDIVEKYLYKTKPTGDRYRTYKFGYTADNPSYEYLRYKIFCEEGCGSIQETFYTLNLRNSKKYFLDQLKSLYSEDGIVGIQQIFKKITKHFLFNEYVIKDEFDVFVAFETMNNRGKKLSDLELLKNRLIYLTTLYDEKELDSAEQKSLRDAINDAWKEVYHQLGRNEKRPLNDDDFLKAHWITYFKYSRDRGNDYIMFLLDEQFSPRNINKKIIVDVELELTEEQKESLELDETEDGNDEFDASIISTLSPDEIKKYVNSLKASAVHWFNSWYPDLANELTNDDRMALDKINRIGIGYFRPLVMSILKNVPDPSKRCLVLQHIERFIFVCFHLCQARRNYRDSEFYNAARELDKGEISIYDIIIKLKDDLAFAYNDDDSFCIDDFYNYLRKKFNEEWSGGYYSWFGLKYFLYEYESSLLSSSRQKKVFWDDLVKTPKDNISIEHIFPQTPDNEYWRTNFKGTKKKDYHYYQGSLGNLLLLSSSINSALQNDGFEEKKHIRKDSYGKIIRNGYSDGSHSEIEVSRYSEWTPETIKDRGLKMLSFMESRWDIKFASQADKEKLLFFPE